MSLAKKIREKATEYLGEDGMDNLRDLGKDLARAGSQVKKATKEVWDDCKDDVYSAGEQVSDFAKEVREDCDNEVLRNAREFYGGVIDKAQSGELKENFRAAQERARVRRAETEKLRRERRKALVRTAKKVVIVLLCLAALVLILVSTALQPKTNEAAPAEPTVTAEETEAEKAPTSGAFFLCLPASGRYFSPVQNDTCSDICCGSDGELGDCGADGIVL